MAQKESDTVLAQCQVGSSCRVEGTVDSCRYHHVDTGTEHCVMLVGITGAKIVPPDNPFVDAGTTPTIPRSFRGRWVNERDVVTITPDGVNFGGPGPACKFTSVTVANEDGTVVEVHWFCPSGAPTVRINVVFVLQKFKGQAVLITVNADDPTAVSIYHR